MALYSHGLIQLWPYIVMADIDQKVQYWPIVMARTIWLWPGLYSCGLYSYGHMVMAYIVVAFIVMARYSYDLYSYGLYSYGL